MKTLKFQTVSNQTDQPMNDAEGRAPAFNLERIPVGVYVVLGSGVTSVIVTIKDGRGNTLFTDTVTATKYYPYGDAKLVATSSVGRPTVTTASIAGGTVVTTWLDLQ